MVSNGLNPSKVGTSPQAELKDVDLTGEITENSQNSRLKQKAQDALAAVPELDRYFGMSGQAQRPISEAEKSNELVGELHKLHRAGLTPELQDLFERIALYEEVESGADANALRIIRRAP